ncbi:MAG: patatin-like phospholipase family protein [Alphaproteobacteria bacterium]|nr:patatin-like phospholipase family protein [Alphaproteobacteria bacterium]
MNEMPPAPDVETTPQQRQRVKLVGLALQGGGAHGAFTWGVLDQLLEEEKIGIEAISATSAGAINAVVLGEGYTTGGRAGAKAKLDEFWQRVAKAARFSPLAPTPWHRLTHSHDMSWNPGHIAFDLMTRFLSPYQWNPLNLNPLRTALEETVDFDRLRAECPIKIFLSATNVRTGKPRVFRTGELTVETVLASSCLPFMFPAVEINGEAFWDGGYMGNPSLYPLIYNRTGSRDVVVVHINPIHRPDIPKTATDIMNRVNEITFNASLMKEMRAIEFVSRLIDDGTLTDNYYRRMLIHAIDAEEFMQELGVSSKLHPDGEFLEHLKRVGREAAARWVADSADRLGKESTVDVRARYL